MSSPVIAKGQTFQVGDSVTATKLHNLTDLATWTITSQATGSLCYFDGTDWVVLLPGSDNDVLTMVDGLPAWVTP
jgi:hypothetical protein